VPVTLTGVCLAVSPPVIHYSRVVKEVRADSKEAQSFLELKSGGTKKEKEETVKLEKKEHEPRPPAVLP